jgi:predicted nucleic acid-binding Zn ribbon protein
MAPKLKQAGAAAIVTLLALALSACLLTPGKFTSALDLRKDGRFSFAYSGEIHMLALSKLADMSRDKPFKPDCMDDKLDPRPCSAAETAEQKKTWADDQAASADKRKRESDQMKAMLGGIDPASPEAAEEFAARLRRQAGWKSVVYKGDGLFLVDFALSGRLDHDFAFPTVERFPLANAFIQLTRHADGTVRIEAPGFSASSGGGGSLAMMSGLAAMGGASDGAKEPPALSLPDGTFTLTTDGQILANNTDEGPQSDPAGQRLAWPVNVRSTAAPTALVRLGG